MPRLTLLTVLLVGILSLSACSSFHPPRKPGERDDPQAAQLLLTKGEDKSINLDFTPDVTRGIHIGDVTTLEAHHIRLADGSSQLLLRPMRRGNTTLMVRDNNGVIRAFYEIRVVEHNPKKIAHEVTEILKNIPGVTIRIVGEHVLIEGQLNNGNDAEHIQDLVHNGNFRNALINLTTLTSKP